MERRSGFLLNACTRCSGDLLLHMEDGDEIGTCLQCGSVVYMKPGTRVPAVAAQARPPQPSACTWPIRMMAASGIRSMLGDASLG